MFSFCVELSKFLIFYFFNRDAAAVMLSGQTADAFATVFVGELVF